MENTIGIVIVGMLCMGIGVYLVWKRYEAIDNARLRRNAQRRHDRGEQSVCRWFVDSKGDWGRVIVKLDPLKERKAIDPDDFPEFLRR